MNSFKIIITLLLMSNSSFAQFDINENHVSKYLVSLDFNELTELLKSKNVKILYSEKHPHAGGNETYSVFFEDTDRIKLEFTYQRDLE